MPWSQLIHRTEVSLIVIPILSAIDLGTLLVCYAGLRIAHISVRWTTLLIGCGLATLMLWATLLMVAHPIFSRTYISESALIGILSFIIAVFAAGEWPARRWYVGVKSRIWAWLARQSRAFFLYLRDHHTFFGWLTLLAAAVHTVLVFPDLARVSAIEVWTGVIALVALAALTATGEWISWATRNRALSTQARWWHLALTLAFLLAFAIHV